jgi:hypothetical protein
MADPLTPKDPFASPLHEALGAPESLGTHTPHPPLQIDLLAGAGGGLSGGVGRGLGTSTSMPKMPSRLYHVVPKNADLSRGLQSLYRRFGNKAYDMFAKRWPEAANLGEYHAHNNMFFDNLPDAQFHADAVGGRIIEIDPLKVDDLKFDKLEGSGYWATTSDVSPDAIVPIK